MEYAFCNAIKPRCTQDFLWHYRKRIPYINKHDRQCTYNVIFRRIHATIFAVERQWVLRIPSVCSRWYPACNAHAPYSHMLPAPLYMVFQHYLINGTIFERKKVIEQKMCVVIFSTTFIWNIFHFKKKWARYDHVKYTLFLPDFNETWIWSCKVPFVLARF
jgi:hypothetical protein